MKKRVQAKMEAAFDVGNVVQVPLHDVDTTTADGKALTLIVVDIVQKKTIVVQCIDWHARLVFWTHYTTQATCHLLLQIVRS